MEQKNSGGDYNQLENAAVMSTIHRPCAPSKISDISLHVSAPGKVILHGEHSVVYGKLAIAAALGLRTGLSLSEESCDSIAHLRLEFTDLNLRLSLAISEILEELKTELPKSFTIQKPANFPYEAQIGRIEKFIAETIQYQEPKLRIDSAARNSLTSFLLLYMALMARSGISHRSLKIKIKSDIHVGSGMGSSASFVVCIVAAFITYIKQFYKTYPYSVVADYEMFAVSDTEVSVETFNSEELQMISDWALQGERVMHGNPSGIDTTLATYGSVVEFRKGSPPKCLSMKHPIRAILINTNIPKDTRKMITKVVNLKQTFPEIIENTFESMELVAKSSINCLRNLNNIEETGNTDVTELNLCYSTINTLFGMNQNLLRILNVSHEAIDHICSLLSKFGLNGKITGAGGGGFVLSIMPKDFDNLHMIEQLLTKENYQCSIRELGGPGVKIEYVNNL